MAIVKMKNAREMSEKDLEDKLKELKLELSRDRASSEIGTTKNPGRIRELRRGIARLMTEKTRRAMPAKIVKKPLEKGKKKAEEATGTKRGD